MNETVCNVNIYYLYHLMTNVPIKEFGIWIEFDESHCKFIIIKDLNHAGWIWQGLINPPSLVINNVSIEPIWQRRNLCKLSLGYWKYDTLLA